MPALVQSGSTRLAARVVNLGIGGLALETDAEVKLDRFLRLQIRPSASAPALDVDVIVRRRERRSDAVRWGVELVDPSPASLALIERLLDERGVANQESATPSEPDGAVDDAAALRALRDVELHGLFESALRSLE